MLRRGWRQLDGVTVDAGLDWPDDGQWMADAVPRADFQLDAGFRTWPFVPNWMLPDRTPRAPAVARPDLPHSAAGYVLTADAVAHPDVLARYFAQFPPLPPPPLRHETARWNSLEVDVLLALAGRHPIVADSFGPSIRAAKALLDTLADAGAAPGTAYGNLDQGWALRIVVAADAVFVLDWDWEAPDARATAEAWRLPRAAVAAQADAARGRMAALHRQLVAACGVDWWDYPGR